MELGISLYPEKESFEEIVNYIKLASKFGFKKIFTSVFSVQGTKEELIVYFHELCNIAHENNMQVCADVNAQIFNKFEAKETDLSVFKKIGFDELRMDFNFGDERDISLINNKENIVIYFNASFVDMGKNLLKIDSSIKLNLCHNFYPERYTGTPKYKYKQLNETWKQYKNVKIASFITSNVQGAHGPWPVYDGYPTIEDHRGIAVSDQIRDMIAMNTDVVYFGNAFASEEELKEASDSLFYFENDCESEFEKIVRKILPNIGNKKYVLSICEESGILDIEKEILYNYKKHCDLGDSSEYMIRSRMTRTIYGKNNINFRRAEVPYFKKGDILIVNDNLKHYAGEVQICLKEMANDGQRNLVGRLDEKELGFIELIEPGDYFIFNKK
ncbi:MAG: MupG family TIM beta-alpha barrel fold protein [Erysipelotrichaceae bacterium]|nr:MupG family TIM beta-alpha barrel fold protein [Erysipelotrichaceae bacterium]MDY5252926.1 MupG family TIM beta-alpha barrel fold protein [Erysipelotrichaceae bacterium]